MMKDFSERLSKCVEVERTDWLTLSGRRKERPFTYGRQGQYVNYLMLRRGETTGVVNDKEKHNKSYESEMTRSRID